MALTEKQIEDAVNQIIAGYENDYITELTDTIIDELSRGLMYSAQVDLTTLARAYPRKAQAILIKYKDKISNEVIDAVTNVLDEAIASDLATLEMMYGATTAAAIAKKLGTGTTTYFHEISQQTAKGIASAVERQNIALNQSMKETWYKVTAQSVTAVNQGLQDREKVLSKGVTTLMKAGITVIPYYRSGNVTTTNQVDVALRRHIVTQLSQMGGRMSLEAMDLYNHDLVITSSHYGARPTHAEWQGLPACRTGRKTIDGVTYPDLVALTEYGDVAGLKGANCRHQLYSYFPGVTSLPDREFAADQEKYGMSSNEYYEATQKQRYYERQIRNTKREVTALEQAGITTDDQRYVQLKLNLKNEQSKIRSWCSSNNLTRQYSRENVYGVSS